MFRIDGATASPTLPAAAPVTGTPGYFTGGDPSVPVPPTAVSVDWLNTVQEELIAILAAAGIAPAKGSRGQVAEAIRALITSGGIAFASDNEAIAGTITNKAVAPRAAAALVADRIAAIVGTPPAALNTIAKLAAAVGGNPNLAADLTTALAARALAARRVSATGLATGGGTLNDDMTIDVASASGAEFNAGTEAAKALTPASFAAGGGGGDGSSGWAPLPGGNMMQWGSLAVIGNGTSVREFQIVFPRPFLNLCGSVVANAESMSGTWRPLVVMLQAPTIAGVTGILDSTDNDRRFSNARTVRWQAIGR